MFHVAIALIFLLMILTPCVIALRVRSREDAQDLAELNRVTLPPAVLESPAQALPELDLPLLPASEPASALDLTDLEEALNQVKLAQAVAQRANLALRDAQALVAAIRAEAAAVSAREAERAAQEAARLAHDADAIYQQMLETEIDYRKEAAPYYTTPDPRKAA